MRPRKLFSGKEQLHPDVWQQRSSHLKKKKKTARIPTWYSTTTWGSGRQQRTSKSSQLGMSSYMSRASLRWLAFRGKVLALMGGLQRSFMARLKIIREQIHGGCLCVKGKGKKKKTFFHIVLPLSAEMPTLLTRQKDHKNSVCRRVHISFLLDDDQATIVRKYQAKGLVLWLLLYFILRDNSSVGKGHKPQTLHIHWICLPLCIRPKRNDSFLHCSLSLQCYTLAHYPVPLHSYKT